LQKNNGETSNLSIEHTFLYQLLIIQSLPKLSLSNAVNKPISLGREPVKVLFADIWIEAEEFGREI